MKRAVLILVMLLWAATAARAQSPLDKPVSLDFESIDIYVVLSQLADQVGLAFVHDHDGQAPRVSITANNRKALFIVDELTASNRLQYLLAGRALVVGSPKMIAQYADTSPLVVKYQNLKASEAVQIVQGVYPFVDAKIAGDTVKYVVPKTFMDKVSDIATSLDKKTTP